MKVTLHSLLTWPAVQAVCSTTMGVTLNRVDQVLMVMLKIRIVMYVYSTRVWHRQGPGVLWQGTIAGSYQPVGILQSFSSGIVSITDGMRELGTSVAISGG